MEKVINLRNDPIFRHAVPYNDAADYTRGCLPDVKSRVDDVKDEIYEMVIQGKLDATDLRIIAARDCSPMPTFKEVGASVGISKQAVHKRVDRFRRLFKGI